MIIILTVLTLLSRLAMMVQGFTNMTTSTATFSATNMEPEYKDGGSVQYFVKLVRNTGYNFHYCTDILPHRRIFISGQSFTSGQELTFDAEHNWNGAPISVVISPGLSYWSGVQYSSRTCRVLVLTSSYQEMYLYTDVSDELDFDIKYEGAAGFTIINNIAATRSLSCMIIRGNIHAGS